ncbi:MAG: hypothetical protein D3914_03810 [Candidatus Electrothrix sp. LOE2]|nr:hypothetical protein [Candidatus Electrothrix sp. LOE2]
MVKEIPFDSQNLCLLEDKAYAFRKTKPMPFVLQKAMLFVRRSRRLTSTYGTANDSGKIKQAAETGKLFLFCFACQSPCLFDFPAVESASFYRKNRRDNAPFYFPQEL